jgi:GT2 family glycosyltransferase
MTPMKTGVVVIGRNEGNRLKKCFNSLGNSASTIVYVDSGSTDGSQELALSIGIDLVSLDMRTPFTAARARNEGFERLRALDNDVSYVQFLDGDCELESDWLEAAVKFLDRHEEVAVVCGRLREKYPNQSIYNTLCDLEWDTPAGNVKACGGIAMMRVHAFEQMRGFKNDLIAGEEPELCLRLRAAGWRIWRLANEMAVHDAAMTHFSQWWNRTIRSGFAIAQGAYLHGSSPEKYKVRESLSVWFWGLALPALIFLISLLATPAGLLLLLAYPFQVIRIALTQKKSIKNNWLRSFFLVIGKFPEMLGQVKFWWAYISRHKQSLIEYK